jgi:hypothetical protein
MIQFIFCILFLSCFETSIVAPISGTCFCSIVFNVGLGLCATAGSNLDTVTCKDHDILRLKYVIIFRRKKNPVYVWSTSNSCF